ncbi:MAG TPA: glycosyl hydrolase 53 family protein [Roseiflexaceae bacterium]|nr:glycosyl hydrolase 53 family protein [Roseiflexaceae bacterium]
MSGRKLIHQIVVLVMLIGLVLFPRAAAAAGPAQDNLAFRSPVLASSTGGANAASRAVDYRYSTNWQAGASGANQWLRVDLGQPYPITGAELRFNNGSTSRGYRIEVSNDAVSWTTMITAPAANTQIRYHPFTATARYVRWFLTSISSGTVQVSEFMVFGPPITPLPPLPFVSNPPPPYFSTGFVRGADVSHLMQQEHYGAVYYDVGNVQRDVLEILKDRGINTIRIKVWNDPGNRAYDPARLHDPLGFNNPYWATRLAVRAREMGFRIMIDFHYSDTWADPGKQFIPHEWLGLSVADTATALHDFTYDTLRTMADHGVVPEWVQIGNEIPGGMLWPLGRNNTTAGWDNLAIFLKAGYNATKAIDPSIKVIVHYDNAGHTSQTQSYYDNLVARNVPWDVTALSYYPQWHGTFPQMDTTMRNLAARYGKPVNIVEVAHPWTTQNFDETGNALGVPSGFPYNASVNGQIGYFNELVTRIKAVPNGMGEGLIYWQPEWTPVPASGWAIGEASGWENAALFNQNGLVLASLNALGNQAPVVSAGPPGAIDEGQTFSSTGSFVDAGINTWTATVDYGDGSGVQPLALNANKTFNLVHTYVDDGAYTITVTVTDDEDAAGSATTMVVVGNVAPVVSAGPGGTINEGETFVSSGSFNDPGADNWEGVVDYGDGSGVQPLALNADQSFDLSHTYLDNGEFLQVVVTINDDDGGVGIDTALVTVNNVAPTALLTNNGPIAEGSSVTVGFSNQFDPSPIDTAAGFRYAFACDGSSLNGASYAGGTDSPSAACSYADGPATHIVRARIIDKDDGYSEYLTYVTVANIAPTVGTPVVSPAPSLKGGTVSAVATFSDPGVNDAPFGCTVDYGDGSGAQPGTIIGTNCTGPDHTYTNVGSYQVTVRVTDKDGGSGTNTTTHAVIYDFAGFYQPIDNLPTQNVTKAGSAIPVKFSLGGNQSLSIFAAGYPRSQPIACDSSAPISEAEETVNAGASSLSYDAGNQRYNYVWKTDKSWSGSCRLLELGLNDGTIYRAVFLFR